MAKRPQKDDAIRAGFVEESSRMVEDAKLTAQERAHIEQLVIRGNSYLDELGWDSDTQAKFFARTNVRKEMDRQMANMADGPGLLERHRFMARVRMCAMIPMALRVVALSLRGTLPDEAGNIQPPQMIPTMDQYRVAQDILTRCGITWDNEVNVKMLVGADVKVTTKNADGEPVKEDRSKYDVHAVTQRERVRTALTQILTVYAKTDEELTELGKKRLNAMPNSPTRGMETDGKA